MADVIFRVIDNETTGMAPPAEIIEIGYTDIVFTPETKAVRITETVVARFDAAAGVPVETIAIHHIQPHMLRGLPTCTPETLTALARGNADCDAPNFLVAHNSAFEQQWFTPEICGDTRWIDTFKCALRIWPEAPAHGNQVLKYWLGLGDLPEDRCFPPHAAGPDSFVTAHILAKMLETELVRDLVGWTLAPRHYPTCPLHKHKGQPWSDIPHSYLTWMLGAADMEADLKAAARAELDFRQSSRT